MLWSFLNNHEEHPFEPVRNSEALGIFLHEFFHRCITTFNMHILLPQYVRNSLSIIDSLRNLVHHQNCQLFFSSLIIWSSSQIDEIKSSFVSVSTHTYSLLSNKSYFYSDWLAEDDIMEILIMSTWEKLQLVKNERVLVVTLARKK